MGKTIAQIPEDDRPREKLLRKGACALSDQELLAVLLGKGTASMDVMTLAAKLVRLMDEKGLHVTANDLTQFDGVGDAKATLVLAAIEFARRRINPALGLQQFTICEKDAGIIGFITDSLFKQAAGFFQIAAFLLQQSQMIIIESLVTANLDQPAQDANSRFIIALRLANLPEQVVGFDILRVDR